uniref:group II intron maturase-specific domain-containing protein n=1 Tax=Methanomethylophilus alvi TaxID=1291540 RepID=UPI0037DBF224
MGTEAVKGLLTIFLKERGLELSEEKTLVTHIDDGFDFLGWNFRKHRNQGRRILIIRPSNKSLQSMKASIKETVLVKGKAKGQDESIRELNPKIRGWCNYHKSAISSRTFCYLDSYRNSARVSNSTLGSCETSQIAYLDAQDGFIGYFHSEHSEDVPAVLGY